MPKIICYVFIERKERKKSLTKRAVRRTSDPAWGIQSYKGKSGEKYATKATIRCVCDGGALRWELNTHAVCECGCSHLMSVMRVRRGCVRVCSGADGFPCTCMYQTMAMRDDADDSKLR